MKNLNLEEIKKILESGDFDAFIDSIENDFFEVKLGSVFTDEESDKINFKLSKYATSFANQNGGYLICGLKTEKLKDIPHDIIIGLDLSKVDNFLKVEEIMGRISQCTHPIIETQVHWYPYKKEPELGLLAIYIPKQENGKKYFYMKMQEFSRELFGVPIRKDGHTDWITVKELYNRSKSRPNNMQEVYEGMSSQIQEVKNLIRDSNKKTPGITDDLITKRMLQLEDDIIMGK